MAEITCALEKHPSLPVGVGTMTKVTSLVAIEDGMSMAASIRPSDPASRSSSPGSTTGARPARSSETCAGMRSTPTTSKPLLARTATNGAPSLPSPTTEIRIPHIPIPYPRRGSSRRWRGNRPQLEILRKPIAICWSGGSRNGWERLARELTLLTQSSRCFSPTVLKRQQLLGSLHVNASGVLSVLSRAIMQISYKASQRAADVIAALGRTEDLKFSPSNKLLAIAGYEKNKIAVFHIEIAKSAHGTKITLTDAFEIYSKELNEPHGLDFLDEETIIVTNRSGDAIFLQLPFGGTVSNSFELAPLGVISSGSAGPLSGPAAVSIFRMDQKLYEALICNNGSSNVTKHLIDLSAGCSVKRNEILLTKWLGVPDGISISKGGHWIAVSNHKMRGVFIYEYTSLNASSEPDGILRYVFSPHGVRFTSDGEFIVVADGAAPYLHIYTKNGSSWRGVHNPIKSLRVL